MPPRVPWLVLLLTLLSGTSLRATEPTSPQALEFFEKEVRPLLAERCLTCHGEEKAKGGLKLISRAAVLEGGDHGPAATPGKPETSLLLKAVRHDGKLKMPPKEKLKDREVAILTRWVQLGLPWPEKSNALRAGKPFQITEEQRQFWAFQPVRPVQPPPVRDAGWCRTELDRFVLAALEARGLRPAPPADRRTLLRRVTFDLTGLPPAPEEVDAFLRDDSPDAFAKVVDRLLASPHYGEHWGRHWLDQVRYADSFDARGVGGAGDIANAWRYRDWVVAAFNRDLPYDRFVKEQLAGDILSQKETKGADFGPVIATEMLAIGNWGGGDADKEKLLTDIVDDQIDVVGRTFLGLTLGCARCHDHKFDPISQADYYALAGIFFSTHILPNVGPKTDGPPMLHIPLAPPAEVARHDQLAARIAALEKQLKEHPQPGKESDALKSELAALRPQLPPLAYTEGAQEGGVPGSPQAGIHDVRIHQRGRYDLLGDLVPRRFPVILAGERQPPITEGSGRLQLAEWLVRPDNPLTARVLVNRLWQYHFGEGIVRTASNFGKLGERPSHPELLDYLARRFVESGWSIKQMHRLILLSAAYQQSSEPRPETHRADPDNRLFGHMNRRRLEAESARDNLLAVSGRLDPSTGGPATRDFNSPRRTLYQMTIRSDRSGFGPLFDAADSTALVSQRSESTVAPQALFLLNHPFAVAQAHALAGRILREGPPDNAGKIERVYLLLFGRPPSAREREIGLQAVNEGAWAEYCQVLLCTNEFIYVD